MFHISCVLVPRIVSSQGYMVQNRGGFDISHGFPVTRRFLLGDSGFIPAEDMQHDQHPGHLGDRISPRPRIFVIFNVFSTPLVQTPSHRTALVPVFRKPHCTV